MTSSKARSVLASIVLVSCLSSTAVASPASDYPHAFTDRGVLYGVSDDSLFINDLRTGEIEIEYADGHRHKTQAGSISVPGSEQDPLLTQRIWLSKHSAAENAASGLCADALRTVNSLFARQVSSCEGRADELCGILAQQQTIALQRLTACFESHVEKGLDTQ